MLEIHARDGYPIAGRLYQPTSPPTAAVLLAGAMAVPQTFYRGFAEFLSNQGMAVLTFDYRGVADSLHGPVRQAPAVLRDWGELDIPAALAYLSEHLPDCPLHVVGHSVGGQLLGLHPGRFQRVLMVASQSGYWRHWSGLGRAAMYLLWHMVIPGMTAACGFMPMRAFRQGENLPSGVVREWASWGRQPDYVGSYARTLPVNGFDTWSGTLKAYAIAGDPYAPESAVRALVEMYRKADTSIQTLPRIGHFGFFRRRSGAPFWPAAAAWLRAGQS